MDKIQRLARFFFAMVLIFLSAAPVLATVAVERSSRDLVHHAEVIVIGTVTDIREQWDAAQQVPITLVTFSDLTILKGTVEEEHFELQFLGGRTPEGLLLVIPGMPRFVVGEKNIVFCAGNRQDIFPLVGLSQGRLRVTFDPQRGVETVSDNARAPLVGIQNGKLLRADPATHSQEVLSLSTFIHLVQQELRSVHGQP
jgi:hypothetical protein